MRRDAPSLGYNAAFGVRDGRRRRAIPTFWKGERCAQHDLPKVVEVSSSGGRDAYSNSGRWCSLQRLHTLKAESPRSSRVIPKAACIWILGEGHSASLRSVGSTSRRHRLCALACSLFTMGRVRASRPVSTRPRRPCPFFCAAKSNFKVPMV